MSTDPAPTTAPGADAGRGLGFDRHDDVRQPERLQPAEETHRLDRRRAVGRGTVYGRGARRRPGRPVGLSAERWNWLV
jgi:hypothetical protein